MEKTRKGGFSGLDSSVSLKQYEHWSNNLSYFLGPVSNVTCSNFGLDGLAAGTTLPLGLLPVDPVVANTNLVPATRDHVRYFPVLVFLNNLWGLAIRNRIVVPARQATLAGGIDSLESILGLFKILKIRALIWTRTVE
jgi:hypothetical protein